MKLRAKHILLSYDKAEMSTHNRPLGVAMQDAANIIRDIETGKTTWNDAAAKNSACPSGKRSYGDLGWFEEEQMHPDFSNAVKLAGIDTLAPPCITPFGVHIIVRTG